jgi:hypothetical protein
MVASGILNEYRRFRRAPGSSPATALKAARDVLAKGGAPKHWMPYDSVYGRAPVLGDAFQCGGSFVRWTENTHSIGLRFVGMADKVAPRSVKHTGWYCSDDNETGETARGAVWQLPARNGLPRFVAGIFDPINEGAALLIVDTVADDEIAAAHRADQLAERFAEREREYQRVSSARFRYDELTDDITARRKECLALIRELKPRLRSFGPALCKALRYAVASQLRAIGKARQERADIVHAFASHDAWES